jgi:hypothetical protein
VQRTHKNIPLQCPLNPETVKHTHFLKALSCLTARNIGNDIVHVTRGLDMLCYENYFSIIYGNMKNASAYSVATVALSANQTLSVLHKLFLVFLNQVG